MKSLHTIFITLLVLQVACGKTMNSAGGATASSPQSKSGTASNQYPNAKIQANALNDAVLAGNYAKAADLTNPKLIELLGGRAQYISGLRQGMNETKSPKFHLLSNVAADPKDIIVQGNNIYAILPTTMKIKVPEGVLVGQSFLIGASNDGGQNWTFVDGGTGNRHQLRVLFPTVAEKLKLPEAKRPVLQRTP